MSVKSMTAYATTTLETVAGTVTIDLKSVNSRFLDIQFRLNDEFRVFEPSFREKIMSQVKRGKVECRLSFARGDSATSQLNLNQSLLETLWRLEAQILEKKPNTPMMRVADILQWPHMIEEKAIDEERLKQEISAALETTLTTFIAEREREGFQLKKVLIEKVDAMIRIVESIEPLIPSLLEKFKQKSIERLQEVLGIATESGVTLTIPKEEIQDRIRQEVALYGMKIDVAEEIARLKVHLNEMRVILEKGGLVGKRMDFMLQELNREANTLGSKAVVKEVSDASVELKILIEQIREQVQNLE